MEEEKMNNPDYSGVTVSMNISEYQRMKEAAYHAKLDIAALEVKLEGMSTLRVTAKEALELEEKKNAGLREQIKERDKTVIDLRFKVIGMQTKLSTAEQGHSFIVSQVNAYKEQTREAHKEFNTMSAYIEELEEKLADSERDGSVSRQQVLHLRDQLKKTNARSNATEQAIVVEYLRKYADCIANLEPNEDLVMEAVTRNRTVHCTCGADQITSCRC
jgi:chromosome segregation ATPase